MAIAVPAVTEIKLSWPYAQSLDSVVAAPKNHLARCEDEHIRLLEVVLRPGETDNFHTDQYPSVIAYDMPLPAEDRRRLRAEGIAAARV